MKTQTQINYRRSENNIDVEITELQEGDFIWNQGYLFMIKDLRFEENNTVFRYKGIVVPNVSGNEFIMNSGFNGGGYGHNNRDKAKIVKRDLIFKF